MNLQADAAERLAVYKGLAVRNRVVGVLRYAVPATGAVVLAALIAQIYISSLGSRFGVGRITVSQDAINVEAPEYAGMLEDGSTYRVWSQAATAKVDQLDQIDLTSAALTLNRTSGVTMQANAPVAVLDTTRRVVKIEGVAYIEDSSGTSGTLFKSEFDWVNQVLDSRGDVHIDYADGATVDAEGLYYDTKKAIWTFTRATVTLPDTPDTRTEDDQTP
jgi:lipopolysaccharide export system protein LptC